MDWERFKRVLELSVQQDPLQLLIEEQPFLVKFLSTLLETLERCPDSRACVSTYPQAGPLLTTAATHPTLATDPVIARLLIACLFEFAKLRNALPNQELSKQERSIAWCIQRVRRLQYASCLDPVIGLDAATKKIQIMLIDIEDKMKHGQLTTCQVSRLLQASLLLVRHDNAAPLIQKLVGIGLDLMDMQQVQERDTIMLSSFPDNFETRLLQDNDMWSLYLTWPTVLKARLWTYFDTLLKKEIYTLLAKHGPQQPSSPEKLSQDIKHTSFMETLSLEPWVLQHIFRHMTETMFTLNDWRIYRIWWHVFRILKSDECQLPGELGKVDTLLMQTESIPQTCCQLQAALTQYIYCGSFDQIISRRSEAWFLTMLHLDFLNHCLYALLRECLDSTAKTWNAETDSMCRYIAWTCCPSDDDRLNATMDQLYQWLQGLAPESENAQATMIINYFASSWADVFNENVATALSASLNILNIAQSWHLDDQKAMLDSIFYLHTTSSSSADRRVVDRPAALLLAQDLLPQICGTLSNIHPLSQYVNELIHTL